MAGATTTYLLRCECGAEIAVTAGQAGGCVPCRKCGRNCAVPKLRELGLLERQKTAEEPSGTAWRMSHAVAFLGSIVCLAALATAGWVGQGQATAVDEQALRAAVAAADDRTIYRIWNEGLSRSGVRRPAADEEREILRRARFAAALNRGLSVVAAAGAVAAAAAGLTIALRAARPGANAGQGARTERP